MNTRASHHLEGLREHHAVESDDVGVVQRLHGGHLLQEVGQCVRLPGHAAPQGLHCYRQLRAMTRGRLNPAPKPKETTYPRKVVAYRGKLAVSPFKFSAFSRGKAVASIIEHHSRPRTRKQCSVATSPHHSAGGRVPLGPLHHPEGAGAQLLAHDQLAVLDQTREGPADSLLSLSLSRAALLPSVWTSTAARLSVH